MVRRQNRARDRVGVGDGARGEHGACDVHGTGSGGADGMRGDGVGVGDGNQMSDRPWRSRHPTCDAHRG